MNIETVRGSLSMKSILIKKYQKMQYTYKVNISVLSLGRDVTVSEYTSVPYRVYRTFIIFITIIVYMLHILIKEVNKNIILTYTIKLINNFSNHPPNIIGNIVAMQI